MRLSDIDVSGARLSFREEGAGRPVILVHGTAATGDQWQSLAAHLAPRYRVVVPDLPGNGGSGLPTTGAGSGLEVHVDAIRALVAHCGEPAHLVGHSFGAAVALSAAVAQPRAMASLTVIEPAAFHLLGQSGYGDWRLYGEVRSLVGVIGAAAACDAPGAGVARFVDFWNGTGAWHRLREERKAVLTRRIGGILADFAAAFGETWALGTLGRLHCPTLALIGMTSPQAGRRITQLVADAMPDAQLHMVIGAGHMLPLTHPEIVDPIVTGHLITADARAPRMIGQAA
jgi:pimeloyl-ACP methyl ester carboxylesterase